MHCALCCVRGSLYVLCGECFVYRVCVLRVVVFIVCVVTVNGHEGTAELRLLPRDIFSQDTGFPASGATVQFMSMTYGHLLQKDLGGFLHQPRGSVQCPGEGAHITLVLGYIILNASKVVCSHLTQSHSQGRGTKPGGRMLLPSPSTFCLWEKATTVLPWGLQATLTQFQCPPLESTLCLTLERSINVGQQTLIVHAYALVYV